MKTRFHSRNDDRLHERSELSLSPSQERIRRKTGFFFGCERLVYCEYYEDTVGRARYSF